MTTDRLKQQLEFVVEIDKLKQVYRQNYLTDGLRKENDAEHSWHLAMMGILLAEYALPRDMDIMRVLKMVLIHDIVEIDAGDTYCYALEQRAASVERERKAAQRLFGLLPADQAREFQGLWAEFEQRQTPEARFAGALDRFQPLLHNFMTKGKSWQEHGITSDQVIARNKYIREGSAALWDCAQGLIREAVDKGYLQDKTGRG